MGQQRRICPPRCAWRTSFASPSRLREGRGAANGGAGAPAPFSFPRSPSQSCRTLRQAQDRLDPASICATSMDPGSSRGRRGDRREGLQKKPLSYIIRLCQPSSRLFRITNEHGRRPACGRCSPAFTRSRNRSPKNLRTRLNFTELWKRRRTPRSCGRSGSCRR